MKSDREAEIPYVTPYIWNLKRNDTNTLIYEIEANSENKLMVAGSGREGCGKSIPLSSFSEILHLFSYPHLFLSLFGCLFTYFHLSNLIPEIHLDIVGTYNSLIHSFPLLLVFHYINTT